VREAGAVWRRRAGWLSAAGLFLAVNAGFFFWYRATGQTRQDALEARQAALEAEVGAAEREAGRLEAQRQRLSRVSAAIEEFYKRRIGTRRATLASIVDEIHATLKRAGIAPAEIGYGIRPVTGLPLSEMNATFGFAADYKKFKSLLDAFETGPRWLVVREIALAREADVPGSVQVRMSIATYFADEKGELPDRPAAAGAAVSAAPRSRS
jgi:Tfp pilus assembly protein PilO